MKRLALAVVLCVVASVWTFAQGTILLEDFRDMRLNGDTPPSNLWAPFDPDGNCSQYCGQTMNLASNIMSLVVPSNSRPYWHFLPYPYNVPAGRAKGRLRSGTWSSTVNRFTFWMRNTGSTINRNSDQSSNFEIGTYSKPPTDTDIVNAGEHWYHLFNVQLTQNRWVYVVLNRVPQYCLTRGTNSTNWTDNPTTTSSFNGSGGWDYYDGLTRFYWVDEFGSSATWGGKTYNFKDFRFDINTAGDPDNEVATVTAQYDGTRYRVTWAGVKNIARSYNVHYSTSSMKTNGFNSGTDGGSVSNPNSDYTGTEWTSPAMAEASLMYFGIQPNNGSAFTEVALPSATVTPGPSRFRMIRPGV